MNGILSTLRLDDPLGHLVPPGSLHPAQIERELAEAMEQRRFLAGHGVASVPTRYVVSMHPSDRAWLSPFTEDRAARALARHADRAGHLIVGEISVEFESDPDARPGKPSYWVGFSEGDLLVLASPRAAATVFAGPS